MHSQLMSGQKALGCARSGANKLTQQQHRAFVRAGGPAAALHSSGHRAPPRIGLHGMEHL
jgi:hypothetical protein